LNFLPPYHTAPRHQQGGKDHSRYVPSFNLGAGREWS
jgi:hypothetical protein